MTRVFPAPFRHISKICEAISPSSLFFDLKITPLVSYFWNPCNYARFFIMRNLPFFDIPEPSCFLAFNNGLWQFLPKHADSPLEMPSSPSGISILRYTWLFSCSTILLVLSYIDDYIQIGSADCTDLDPKLPMI